MNRESLRERVREMAGARDPNLVSDGRVNDLLNEAHSEVLSAEDWPFLWSEQAVESSGREVLIPEPVRQVSAVTYGTKRLLPESVQNLDFRGEDTWCTPDEVESYVRRDEGTLLLWPTPEENIQVGVRGWLVPVDMDGDQAEPMFGSEFHHIVAYSAAAALLLDLGDAADRREGYLERVGQIASQMSRRYLRSADVASVQFGGEARQRRGRRHRTSRGGGHGHGGGEAAPHSHPEYAAKTDVPSLEELAVTVPLLWADQPSANPLVREADDGLDLRDVVLLNLPFDWRLLSVHFMFPSDVDQGDGDNRWLFRIQKRNGTQSPANIDTLHTGDQTLTGRVPHGFDRGSWDPDDRLFGPDDYLQLRLQKEGTPPDDVPGPSFAFVRYARA